MHSDDIFNAIAMIPSSSDFNIPILTVMKDGKTKWFSTIIDEACGILGVTREQREATARTAHIDIYLKLGHMALKALKKIKYVKETNFEFTITPQGKDYLDNYNSIISKSKPDSGSSSYSTHKASPLWESSAPEPPKVSAPKSRKAAAGVTRKSAEGVTPKSTAPKTRKSTYSSQTKKAPARDPRPVTPTELRAEDMEEIIDSIDLTLPNPFLADGDMRFYPSEGMGYFTTDTPRFPDVQALGAYIMRQVDELALWNAINAPISIQYVSSKSWKITIGDESLSFNFEDPEPAPHIPAQFIPTPSTPISTETPAPPAPVTPAPPAPVTPAPVTPAPAASVAPTQAPPKKKPVPIIETTGVWIIRNSQNTIAVYGDTEPFRDKFLSMGGYLSPKLNHGAGWVFLSYQEKDVAKFLEPYIIPKPAPQSRNSSLIRLSVGKEDKEPLPSASLTRKQKADLKTYVEMMKHLKTMTLYGLQGPYKAIMLMALFDLIHSHRIIDPKIFYNKELEDRYYFVWKKFMGNKQAMSPALVFVRLGQEPFFNLQLIKQISDYGAPWTKSLIKEFIHCANLDFQLYSLLRMDDAFVILTELLFKTYCLDAPQAPPRKATRKKKEAPKEDPDDQKKEEDDIEPDGNPTLVIRKCADNRRAFRIFLAHGTSTEGRKLGPNSINLYSKALDNPWVLDKARDFYPEGGFYDINSRKILSKVEKIIKDAASAGIIPQAVKTAFGHYLHYVNFIQPVMEIDCIRQKNDTNDNKP